MTIHDLLHVMRGAFPKLTVDNFRPTSPSDENYNCIAWAAGDTNFWWWPDAMGQYYWPPNVRREETIDAFVQAFECQGYSQPTDATVEPNKQKVAIYADSGRRPTHAARQLSNGWWASKLGCEIDIEHELSALEGPWYGAVAIILAKPSR